MKKMKRIKLSGLIKILMFTSFMSLQAFSKSFSDEMPVGGNVVSGSVSISNQNANHMIINQTTDKSIINWQSFSIHEQGRVDFNMPNSNSISLNRVSGSTTTRIAGKLNSNGQIYLVNPNGVFVTPSE